MLVIINQVINLSTEFEIKVLYHKNIDNLRSLNKV